MNTDQFSPEILSEMKRLKIDPELTAKILDSRQKIKRSPVKELPAVDGKQIIKRDKSLSLPLSGTDIDKLLEQYPILKKTFLQKKQNGDKIVLSYGDLEDIGRKLFSLYSYGVLNGGSATSYADLKKNRKFNEELFKLYEKPFKELRELSIDKPKGITPAFLQDDGSPGPSFLELKFRNLLLHDKDIEKTDNLFFEMTSYQTEEQLKEAYQQYRNSPYLKNLLTDKNKDLLDPPRATQPLIAAYTQGENKKVFTDCKLDGQKLLALPGGHGQCFMVLKNVFQQLYNNGKRFVSLGNVDNTGYTFDPVGLAMLALTGRPAAFDFSFKTEVDVKGGVLVRQEDGRLNCVDLGVGISKDEVAKLSAEGHPVLFNCANGLFNLEYLLDNIDRIIDELPLRFSNQDKDAGKYSQAEQVTWEVINLIADPMIFAVDKFDRFLAAKMLMETLMTSGYKLDSPDFPREGSILETAEKLSRGLSKKLENSYGLKKHGDGWKPVD